MLLSIFTPTSDLTFLEETYDSIRAQGYATEWEWVIVPNGPTLAATLPPRITADANVRVVPYAEMPAPEQSLKIGELKRFACDNCRGDVFVELDHDDLLVPGVLAEIAAKVAAGAGFVYSDDAQFRRENGTVTSHVYHSDYGWESYPFEAHGMQLKALRAFPATARSLCQIHFAPDHIRAWTRDAYYEAGGHDVSMLIGDDHDLVIRTYLAGVPFAHTGTCGYLYRNHPAQNYLKHNAAIQSQSATNCRKYLLPLIKEWCCRSKLPTFTIENRDNDKLLKEIPGMQHDSVGHIRMVNCLHHTPQDMLRFFMEHVYRVLVPGGWFTSLTPSTRGPGAFVPTAQSYWNPHSFRFLTEDHYWKEWGKPHLSFQSVVTQDCYPAQNYADHGLWHVSADLCAMKGQLHHPGRVYLRPPE